jgi:hypothetical protein
MAAERPITRTRLGVGHETVDRWVTDYDTVDHATTGEATVDHDTIDNETIGAPDPA